MILWYNIDNLKRYNLDKERDRPDWTVKGYDI